MVLHLSPRAGVRTGGGEGRACQFSENRSMEISSYFWVLIESDLVATGMNLSNITLGGLKNYAEEFRAKVLPRNDTEKKVIVADIHPGLPRARRMLLYLPDYC